MRLKQSTEVHLLLTRNINLVAAAGLVAVLMVGCSGQSASSNARMEEEDDVIKKVGIASWYGPGFENQTTASGETFDPKLLTAASPDLPLGSTAVVTNLDNGKTVEVKINDRGPYVKNRILDLSHAAAKKLGMVKKGWARVKIRVDLD